MSEQQLSREEKVKVFLELKTHDEKCAYFHAHPELATIFGGHHFPKPKPATTTTTPNQK
ncbi:MAG: hypothetical protein ABFD89_06615 [Bryobacteraceae bacterium]